MGDGGEARVPLCAQLLGTLVRPPGKQQVSEMDPANRRRSSTPESKLTASGQDQQVSQEAEGELAWGQREGGALPQRSSGLAADADPVTLERWPHR